MNFLEKSIDKLCQAILWVSTTVIFLILVANTVLRYITGASLQWANEVPELLFPWLVMAGVVLAALRGAHITTTFLVERLASRVRRLMFTLGWLVVALMYGVLSWATFKMLDIVHDEKSSILQIPGSVTYTCVMVGMVLLAVLAMTSAWRSWNDDAADSVDGDKPIAVHW
jgi:TRAP-type transport system small permease protein